MTDTMERPVGNTEFPNMMPVNDVMNSLVSRSERREKVGLDFSLLDPDDPFIIDQDSSSGVMTPYIQFRGGEKWELAQSGVDHLCTVLRMDRGDYQSPHTPPEERVFRPNCRLRRMALEVEKPIPIGFAASEICPRERLGVFTQDGKITSFVDMDHGIVPAYQVLDRIASVVDDEALVRTFHTEDDTVTIDLLSPRCAHQVEAVLGKPQAFTDMFFGGMSFTHNDSGSGVTQLRTFLWRQWCMNGATIQHPIRMTRLSLSAHEDAVDRYLDAIGGSAKRFWDEIPANYFHHVGRMAETAYLNGNGELDTDAAFAEIDEIPGVPNQVRDMIRRAYADDPMGHTQYGVMNAITSVAHMDSIDWTTQRRLEAYGGQMVHHQVERCGECRQRIKQRTRRRHSEI